MAKKKAAPPSKPLGDAAPTPTPAGEPRGHPIWDRPVTPKQLARFLQVSPRTVSRIAKNLPHVKVAGQLRFVPNDVLNHLRKKS
ncbi:MAG: helix-turn-helix domain-containing protein [Gemmatimonadota bacterium]|nr:MAG: helix-turn-helix domain-containing protein [Gemmatimonadota bacterium]